MNTAKQILFLFLFYFGLLTAQVDTLVVYDVKSQEIEIIEPPLIDLSRSFDHTDWNIGSYPGKADLPLTAPLNTPENSGFTSLIPAQKQFNVSDYPIRTAVTLFRYSNDTLLQWCSGVMISNNLVLTAAHCIFYSFDSTGLHSFSDSILVAPAYDNAEINPQFGKSVSSKFYIPKTWYDRKSGTWDDIGLIELQEPLGFSTGWLGLAFNQDDSFFQENMFHKISYPGQPDPADTTKVYNGDTLYYNYGTLDLIQTNYLGFDLVGIPGQSGSPLFYTDNISYFVFGPLNWSIHSRHRRIDSNTFYVLKNIIDNVAVPVIGNRNSQPVNYILGQNYPNPFNASTRISYYINQPTFVKLNIYNISGQVIKTLVNGFKPAGQYFSIWDGRSQNKKVVASGIYFYGLKVDGDPLIYKRMLLVK